MTAMDFAFVHWRDLGCALERLAEEWNVRDAEKARSRAYEIIDDLAVAATPGERHRRKP